MDSLPQHAHLPFLYFSIADLEACQDAEVISEAAIISDSIEVTFEVCPYDPLCSYSVLCTHCNHEFPREVIPLTSSLGGCHCMHLSKLSTQESLNMPRSTVCDKHMGCRNHHKLTAHLAYRCDLDDMMQSERETLEQMSCSWEDVRWAMSVLHSRCFLVGSPPVRTIVPGVDMANHSFEPSAAVRCVQAMPCLLSSFCWWCEPCHDVSSTN